MSESMKAMILGIYKLHVIAVAGCDGPDKVNQVRAQMEQPWSLLTLEEQEQAAWFSVALNCVECHVRELNLTPTGGPERPWTIPR